MTLPPRPRIRPTLLFKDKPHGAAAEAYRSLRTAMQFLPSEKRGPVVFTSCSKGEGKTACVSNLGVALASAGARVLLVDADLRSPRLHDIFHLQGPAGLATLLAGTVEAAAAVRDSGVAGLQVVPCGQIPQDPSELIGRPILDDCLKAWKEDYDYVLFDAPPLLGITDPLVLGRRVGRAVLVVRAVRTTDRALGAAAEQLRDAGIDVLGAVITGHRFPQQDYGYAYARAPAAAAAPTPPTHPLE